MSSQQLTSCEFFKPSSREFTVPNANRETHSREMNAANLLPAANISAANLLSQSYCEPRNSKLKIYCCEPTMSCEIHSAANWISRIYFQPRAKLPTAYLLQRTYFSRETRSANWRQIFVVQPRITSSRDIFHQQFAGNFDWKHPILPNVVYVRYESIVLPTYVTLSPLAPLEFLSSGTPQLAFLVIISGTRSILFPSIREWEHARYAVCCSDVRIYKIKAYTIITLYISISKDWQHLLMG